MVSNDLGREVACTAMSRSMYQLPWCSAFAERGYYMEDVAEGGVMGSLWTLAGYQATPQGFLVEYGLQ